MNRYGWISELPNGFWLKYLIINFKICEMVYEIHINSICGLDFINSVQFYSSIFVNLVAYDKSYTGKRMAQWTRKIYSNAIFPVFAIEDCGIHNLKAESLSMKFINLSILLRIVLKMQCFKDNMVKLFIVPHSWGTMNRSSKF
jgi:Na+/H+ antiporter NhaA